MELTLTGNFLSLPRALHELSPEISVLCEEVSKPWVTHSSDLSCPKCRIIVGYRASSVSDRNATSSHPKCRSAQNESFLPVDMFSQISELSQLFTLLMLYSLSSPETSRLQ